MVEDIEQETTVTDPLSNPGEAIEEVETPEVAPKEEEEVVGEVIEEEKAPKKRKLKKGEYEISKNIMLNRVVYEAGEVYKLDKETADLFASRDAIV
jgi:hypothetical protein